MKSFLGNFWVSSCCERRLMSDDSVRTFLTWWGWKLLVHLWCWVAAVKNVLSCKPFRACRSRQRGMIRTAAWRWLTVGCWFQRRHTRVWLVFILLVGSNSGFWRRTLGHSAPKYSKQHLWTSNTLRGIWDECSVMVSIWCLMNGRKKRLHLPRWWSLFKLLYFLVLKNRILKYLCLMPAPWQIPLISLPLTFEMFDGYFKHVAGGRDGSMFPEGDGLFRPQRLGGDRICFDNVWRWGRSADLGKSRGFCWNNSNKKKNMTLPRNLEVGAIWSQISSTTISTWFRWLFLMLPVSLSWVVPRILQRSSSSVDGRAPWISYDPMGSFVSKSWPNNRKSEACSPVN